MSNEDRRKKENWLKNKERKNSKKERTKERKKIGIFETKSTMYNFLKIKNKIK